MMRSALALGVLATGLAVSGAQAQPYPPPPTSPIPRPQGYQPPLPAAPAGRDSDDDDDDIPPHQRAAPGNYPPPPGGYRGPFARGRSTAASFRRRPMRARRRSSTALPMTAMRLRRPMAAAARSAMASPNPTARRPQAYPQHYQQPTAAQPYPPQHRRGAESGRPQGPIQLAPDARPPRDVTGAVRPNTVATLPPEDQPETGKFELPAQFKRQLVTFQTNEPAGTLVIDTANTLSLSRARQRAGDALRHRRRPRGLHLGGRGARLAKWPSGRTGIRRRK